jgi:ferredoxin
MVTAYHAKSKVTACHAMRGTRSSGDDIREGDAILEVAMDNNKDLYVECRTRGDILNSNVTEGILSFPPVESMVTAYHAESNVTACNAMRGTRSSGNNIREGDAILEVAMDNDEDLHSECHTRD